MAWAGAGPHYRTLKPAVFSGNGRRERRKMGSGVDGRPRQMFTGSRLSEYRAELAPEA